jgi:hypothetical protein
MKKNIALGFIAGSMAFAIPAFGQADDVADAEKAVADIEAELLKAKNNLAKRQKIAELREQLAKVESELVSSVRVNKDIATQSDSKKVEIQNKKSAEETKTAAEKSATEKFGGIELGAGLSFTYDIGKNDRITEAEIVNGIIRVKNSDNSRARIMLESHYFFKPRSKFFGLEKDMWGVGPFVAIQPGSEQIIEAIGLGIMFGFRRALDKPESFNLGFGIVIDPNTQILGDGLIANQPLPAGETEIRYKETSQAGAMAIASFSF